MSIGLSEGLLSFGLSGSISASRGLGAKLGKLKEQLWLLEESRPLLK